MFKHLMNKRVARRKEGAYALKYSFIDKDDATIFDAEASDISINGFSVEIKDVINIGAAIKGELTFPLSEVPIKFSGKIVRAQKLGSNKYVYGISFDQIDEVGRTSIGVYTEKMDLDTLLMRAVKRGATSVHLTIGYVPVCRVDGLILHLDVVPISHEDMDKVAACIMNEKEKAELYKNLELDLAYRLPQENRRFRVNISFDKGNLAMVIKVVNNTVKSLEELCLPPLLNDFVNRENGLIILSGPVDSGKSTTLAWIIESINKKRESVVISIEDPIEYVYTSKNSLICQRDVGLDTLSFSNALKSSLRQDADVVLVGEMRDLDSISQTITAAERGQLVFSTLHSFNAIECINRLIDVFPEGQQAQIRLQLSSCLECIICQRLLPRADGKGRIVATEILVVTPAVRNLIRTAHAEQIYSYLESGAEFGMHTMDSSVADLFRRGLITKETATFFTSDKKRYGFL